MTIHLRETNITRTHLGRYIMAGAALIAGSIFFTAKYVGNEDQEAQPAIVAPAKPDSSDFYKGRAVEAEIQEQQAEATLSNLQTASAARRAADSTKIIDLEQQVHQLQNRPPRTVTVTRTVRIPGPVVYRLSPEDTSNLGETRRILDSTTYKVGGMREALREYQERR